MKCNNITSYFYQVVNLYFFMGTAQACGGGCALVRLRQTQTSHIHKKSARIISSLIRALFTIKS